MPKYLVEYEGFTEIEAEDEEQAEFFILEDVAGLENIYLEITEVKELNASN